MGLECFQPQGNSQLIAATTTASTAVQPSNPGAGVRIYTDGPVFFAFGSSAGSSSITAAIPSTSTPANGIAMLGGSVEAFNIGPNAYLSFITTSSTGASVRFTAGNGL